MSALTYDYPITLNRDEIAQFIAHRGAIFTCEKLIINGPHDYVGLARWPTDNAIIEGHFPGMPIVPGVMLIESMAQLAGTGLLRGDPYVQTLPNSSIGVLAGIRSCWFKRAVLPNTDVTFAMHCRQMAPLIVEVTCQVTSEEADVAKLDIVLAYASKDQLLAGPN